MYLREIEMLTRILCFSCFYPHHAKKNKKIKNPFDPLCSFRMKAVRGCIVVMSHYYS